MKKVISVLMCAVLALSVLCTAGCGNSQTNDAQVSSSETAAKSFKSGSVLGEGSTMFKLAVTDAEGEKSDFEIHTDKKTVGEALEEIGMIAGDPSEYGLYVKTVNGITLDYNKDGKYWSFYVNGAYAEKGVDSTEIETDTEYSFVAQ
ncbi:MAG: DUF4430 domain-containing protein [Ruminococcus sp.]|nr:DUF4430 domain-containing protein [Ruminococcus sp.]